ncbi:NAD regulator [Glycocaulis profundi]|nr:NAD regulator [Glycocaulis profundi]
MRPDPESLGGAGGLVVGLNAVIFAAEDGEPKVLVSESPPTGETALPFGPFDPALHRTFEIGLREWVREQTGFELGYVEQLYTFGDRGREAPLAALAGSADARVISVGYLGLAPEARPLKGAGARWADWSRFFPWEDHRAGRPAILSDRIEPELRGWADEAAAPGRRAARLERIRACFGMDGAVWNEERALDRYELLYEAELVAEAKRDQSGDGAASEDNGMGESMASDHRRILATAISRLRGKIKYRPIVFELMGETFTLSALQKTVEGIAGFPLHKQNFRRALDRAGFVEGTGKLEARTGGRPAELHRFRKDAARTGAALGLAIPRLR